MKARGRPKKQCPPRSKKSLRASSKSSTASCSTVFKKKRHGNTKNREDKQDFTGSSNAISNADDYNDSQSGCIGRFLDFKLNFGEHSFVRLPSQVVEPLLKWRRVLVKSSSGQVIPLASDGKPMNDDGIEQPISSANSSVQDTELVQESSTPKAHRASGRNFRRAVKRELDTTFEEACKEDKRDICGLTRRSQKREWCDADGSPGTIRKRPRRCPSGHPVSDIYSSGNCATDYSIKPDCNVYAVYFGTYYAAKVLSGDGYNGYSVRFLADSIVKNVPPEAVVPVNLVAIDQECFVGEDMGRIAGTPADPCTGLFTVSLLDQDNNTERSVYVRWSGLSFPLSTWRKERSHRIQQKVDITSSKLRSHLLPSSLSGISIRLSDTHKIDEGRFQISETVLCDELRLNKMFLEVNLFLKREPDSHYDEDLCSSEEANAVDKRKRKRNVEPIDLTRSPRSLRRRQPRVELKVTGKQEQTQTRNCLYASVSQSPRWRRTPLKEDTLITKDPTLFYPLWPMYHNPDPELKTFVSLNSWAQPVELSALLKMFSPSARRPYNSFLVTLSSHPWHCQYRVASSSLSNRKDVERFEKREKLIEQMKTAMQRRDPQNFQQYYPHCDQRMDFKKEWRVNLRIAEAMINRRLNAFHIAPIFIESWTRRLPSQIYFDYLPRSTMSVRVYHEMQEVSARLRWRYPTRADGCLCEGGKCELNHCPCLMYKEKGAVMICGQACGCNDSCPSSYLKKERQVPLVLFHTRYKGWGVVTPVEIPAGTFVGLYTGHIVDAEDEVLHDNTYVFEINQQVENRVGRYAVDGTWSGNISRFFNHSCVDPTVVAKVLFTRGNLVTHDLAFFTTRDVHIGEELTFCYSKEIMQQRSSGITCRCTNGCKSRI